MSSDLSSDDILPIRVMDDDNYDRKKEDFSDESSSKKNDVTDCLPPRPSRPHPSHALYISEWNHVSSFSSSSSSMIKTMSEGELSSSSLQNLKSPEGSEKVLVL